MLRRTILAGALLAPLILSACDDKDTAGPNGTAGTVTVRAYVDTDGSGTFTAGDTPIVGGIVTLTNSQSAVQTTANTNASGLATFESVTPGAYSTSLSGTPPAGAVLSSATHPTVVIPFSGQDVSTEFLFVFNPGSISGQLYRDNNGNNTFDAGDTPAPGQTVALYRGTDTTATGLVGTVTTDATGTFTFATLRPGDYTIKITAIPTIQIVGGTTQTVTVGSNAVQVFPVKFTGNLIGTIAEARAAAVGAIVAFEGIATVGQNTFASPVSGGLTSQQIYVQDATAGILVFNIGTAPGIAAGDSVRVVGTRGVNATEVQVTTPTVTKLSTKTVPAARIITEAQAVALQFQGQLVSIPNLLVRNIGTVSTTTGSYNVGVGGPLPADTFTIRIPSSNTGIPASTWVVGQRYDVTGDMGVFNNVANLKPRSLADVKLRSPAISIAAARLRPANDTVTVEGVVYVATNVFNVASTYIMDSTGGINIFNVPTGTTLVPGDSIRVRGLITIFNGEIEVARFSATSPPVIEKLGTGTIPSPSLITVAQLASKLYDGQLVRVNNIRVDSMQTASTTTGSFNVFVTASDGTKFVIRNDRSTTGITNANFTVGSRYDITGAAVNFTSGTPAVTTPQIKPRSPADIVLTTTPADVMTIAQARALAAGATVTVEGVAYVATNVYNVASTYIMDGTGGINIFNVPTGTTISAGDYIRVRGLVTVFNGEIEVARFSSTSPPVIEKLGTSPIPAPSVISFAQLASKEFDGQLVRVNNVRVDSMQTASTTTGSFNVFVTAPDGSKFIVRNDRSTTGITNANFTVGSRYDITGAAVNFTSGTPAVTTPQIKPRSPADIVPTTAPLRASVQAAFTTSPAGTRRADGWTPRAGINSR
ncbi:MAG: SdrD B-like domain-containing protein [Longimicrobiales bacterium]